MKKCYLRKTEITLADGNVYTFRALPLSPSTMPIIRALIDDSVAEIEKLEHLVKAVALSLSYDQEEAAVTELLESGLANPSNKEIMAAMVAGIAGE
jgi:hypothetical protein